MDNAISQTVSATRSLLHVGCGPRGSVIPAPFNTAAWRELRLDIDVAVEPDIIGSMTDMSAVADASMDALYTSHTIEHLHAYDVPVSLAEISRVLKADGFCVITCPDLQAAAEMVAQDKLLEVAYESPAGPITPFDIIFSYRPFTLNNPFMWHRCGFTASVLGNELLSAGFPSVTVTRFRPGFALWAVAAKIPKSEDELADFRRSYFPGS